jgi:hypothetical protein
MEASIWSRCTPELDLEDAKVEEGAPLFFVNLPFVAIKLLNAALPATQRVLPDDLLRLPSHDFPWSWTDFEQLFGHLQPARMTGLQEVRQGFLVDLQMTKRALERGSGGKSAEHAKRQVQDQLTALTAKNCTWLVAEIFPGAVGSSILLEQPVVLNCNYTQHVEQRKCLSLIDGRPEASSTTKCSDGSERELGTGVFACCAGTALIDHRFTCATPHGKPFKFMVQDKYSHIDASGGTVKAADVVAWYRSTLAAFAKYAEHYNLVLVFFSNRRIVGQVSGCPQLLIVASQELPHYLGPDLVGRGLLRSQSATRTDVALQQQHPLRLPPTPDGHRPVKSASGPEEKEAASGPEEKEDSVNLIAKFNSLGLEELCNCRRSCGNRCPCSYRGCARACGCPAECKIRDTKPP